MESQLPIEEFNPGNYAGKQHNYEGTHVITGPIPLTEVVFIPAADVLKSIYGNRSNVKCPKANSLAVEPSSPHFVKGREDVQVLNLACEQRYDEQGAGDFASAVIEPICKIKAKRRGVGFTPQGLPDPDQVRKLSDNVIKSIRCPFLYLCGEVQNETGKVFVAIEAYNPNECSANTVSNVPAQHIDADVRFRSRY